MTTNFPTSLDAFTNPSATDAMDSVTVPHATQHADLNDAVEALQAKVGVDGSAVTTSLDYKVANQGLIHIATVDFTTQTAVNLNNVFSADYVTYRVVVTLRSSSAQGYVYLRMRTGSTTATAGYYEAVQALNFSGTASNLTLTNGSEWRVGGVSGDAGSSIDIYQPFDAAQTLNQFGAMGSGAGYVEHYTGGGLLDTTTSYDGLTLLLGGTTTMSGRICVYAYND